MIVIYLYLSLVFALSEPVCQRRKEAEKKYYTDVKTKNAVVKQEFDINKVLQMSLWVFSRLVY
jgi:hypothetical protein